MNLTKKRWSILAAFCVINLCIGSLYAWSVFAGPMAEYISAVSGKEIKSLAIVFTIANSVGPITMISGGIINDRIGPKWVIFGGGLLFGAGMMLSSLAKRTAALCVTYGLGVGLACGMVYGSTVSNAVKFFPDRRGLIGGIAAASYGISSVIIPVIAQKMIAKLSITSAFVILGAVMTALIWISGLFVVPCPPDFRPDGWTGGEAMKKAGSPDKNWRQMIADKSFYIMLIMLLCGAFSGLMIISQASLIAVEEIAISPAGAAAAVSALAMCNTLGRIAAGWVYDRIGARKTLRLFFSVSVAGQLLLLVNNGISVVFFAGIMLVGVAFGAVMGIYPGYTAARFGSKNNSVNYGIMFIGFAAAGYLGPIIMSDLFSATGRYAYAFAIAAALAVIGIVLTFLPMPDGEAS